MNFKEVKTWARESGYDVLKSKGQEEYLWTKEDDPSISGICHSVKQLATEIYNHKTGNQWLDYQQEYIKSKAIYISDNEYK